MKFAAVHYLAWVVIRHVRNNAIDFLEAAEIWGRYAEQQPGSWWGDDE